MTDEARLQRWLNGQRRSHPRTFQSREMVWSSFEGIARDTGTSMDQLIAEAMEAYAEQRGYRIPDDPPEEAPPSWEAPSPYMQDVEEARDPLEETHDAPGLDHLDRSYAPPVPQPPAPPPRKQPSFDATAGWDDDADYARTEMRSPAHRRNPALDIREPGEESRTKPRPQATTVTSPSAQRPTNTGTMPAAIARPVPTPAAGMVSRGTRPLQPLQPLMPPGTGTNRAAAPPREPPTRQPPVPLDPPPPPRQPAREPDRLRDTGSNPARAEDRLRDTGSNPSMKRLVLTTNNRPTEVDKERFVLGRSKTQADLRLEDPNVSRQHAAIERVGSAWYLVDLGSTNGVFVNGQRITRHALRDGDLIVITSQEIRCAIR
jgi:hypothetical protein